MSWRWAARESAGACYNIRAPSRPTGSGTLRVDECNGSGRSCFRAVGSTQAFELRLQRSGDVVVGLWEAVPLQGTVDGEGRLTVAGSHSRFSPEVGEIVVHEMTIAIDGADTLSATTRYTSILPAASERGSVHYRASVDAASRRPDALREPFSGTWRGFFLEHFVGRSFFGDAVRDFRLVLNQQGSTVSGTMDMVFLRDIAVTGRTTGDEATLDGEGVDAYGRTVRLQDFRVRRDDLGQMSGGYTLAYLQASPRFELMRVVRSSSAP